MSKTPLPGIIEAQTLTSDQAFDCDVCIIGSGAGGAVAAATLQKAGQKVIVVEEGGYFTSERFRMREHESMGNLYQNSGLQVTKNGDIAVMQGKAVGGTTVVNWTTSYRTPKKVLDIWAKKHAVTGVTEEELAPHFDAIEERLHIHTWPLEQANRNNKLLYDGCTAMGWEAHALRRNVKACADTGACGLGCPVDAKQSMLVSYLPDAMDHGATIISRCRVQKLDLQGGAVSGMEGVALDAQGVVPTGVRISVRAKRYILAAGAIGTPGILLRSGVPDPHGRVGVRTFIHPVIVSAALYDEPVIGYRGAPQSVASKHFYDRGDEVGFLLEAVPVYPGLFAAASPGFGIEHHGLMQKMNNVAVHLALTADGLHDDVPGGTVKLRDDGSPLLDYTIAPRTRRAFMEAQKLLARMQLATGATKVITIHEPPLIIKSEKDIAKIESLSYGPHKVAVFSAHVMGGAAMSDDPKLGVVRAEDARHHQLDNLYVMDGSLFPTSLGVNPQESIYGLSSLMASRLAKQG
jgi:choline dehydrogenase-like flavoprotein